MTSIARWTGLATAVVIVILAAVTPAGADEVVATLERDAAISAYGGVVAWSSYDAKSARYRLILRRGGVESAAQVAPSRRPFDVSLGPNAAGRVVALYTRCRTTTRGCDVYRYDVQRGLERRLAFASSAVREEASPVQWGDRVAFVLRARAYVNFRGRSLRPDPRGRRGGGKLVACDVPYVVTPSTGRAPRRLDRGDCAATTGMSIRGERIVQLTSGATGGEGASFEVRVLRASGGRGRRLARTAGGFGGGYSPFASPSQSASAVWLTRFGSREPNDFLRIEFAGGQLTAVHPNVLLAGSVARDERGTFWYVQRPEAAEQSDAFDGFPPFCTSSLEPCRLVRASASPFSDRERALPAQIRLDSATIVAPFADGAAVTGDATVAIVRRSAVVRRQGIAGVTIELLHGATDVDPISAYAATGRTTTTDAAGRWSFTITAGQPFELFAAVARAPRLATGVVDVLWTGVLTLRADAGTLTGTVTPPQPGRTVQIQRLTTDAGGRPPEDCDPSGAGPRACTEEQWTTVTRAPLDATGSGFSAAVDRLGYYRADLSQDGLSGYDGRSPFVHIG